MASSRLGGASIVRRTVSHLLSSEASTSSANLCTSAAKRAVAQPGAKVVGAGATPATSSSAAVTSPRELLTVFKQLSKARLSALVVLSAAAGFVAGSGETVEWTKLGLTSFGTFACAASANTLNQIYEVEKDKLMKRTCKRPLPTGKITPKNALIWAVGSGVVGCATLYASSNATTAALGAANIVLYAGVYTPLKQVSMWNTWVGALVGAVPPLMGWAAASGGLEPGSFVLASALHFWQLPHFFSLAWICREDYGRGGYKMLSLMDKTGKRTAACALRNCIYLLPLGFLAQHFNVATEEFTYEAAALSTVMACSALVFYTKPSVETARILFRASLLHLPLYMGSLLMHRIPRGQDKPLGKEEKSKVVMPPFPFLPVPGVDFKRGG
ncbi:protoheme IX farnesyltransferase [Chloropicon primus]|uniref:Heme O synthase n=1 Tax=Chloropicon primus TaxID=1764295 RepID=A0A5B8MIM4_9CHLO|nr:protoheme IX farnesyltransferase [Chloropicon primus]UPQ98429.1 protoheme IX farnesyltransferase [Chloropicon primus]|eukprot:QDZ19220.1 protoheme IX farnesyltransferase [Chloropicon primus]